MPANLPIQFTFAGFPPEYCPANWNRLGLDFAALLAGYLPGFYSLLIVSETEPSAEDRSKIWFKLEGDGSPEGNFYIYNGGAWVSRNLEPAGSQARRIFRGSPADIWAYDGGDGTDPASSPPTDTTGAMWEIDTDFAARSPIGVGTLPLSGTAIAQGGTGGVDQVTLTEDQIPAHTHPPLSPSTSFVCGGGTLIVGMGSTPAASSAATTGETGGDDPHDNMSPYLGVYFIKRTARVFRVA